MNALDYQEHTALAIEETPIPDLLHITLAVFEDERGDFTESFNREKLVALGLPADFQPVQANRSRNLAGATRGIHAEPWNKYISVSEGQAFAAIVDLRPGLNFGEVFCCILNPGNAIYVPRGCGNAFQALEDTVYGYLVDEHWSPEARYTLVNLGDPDLAIPWPIPLEEALLSDKDRSHPSLQEVLDNA